MAEITPDAVLDVRGEACPYPFIRTKWLVEQIASGEVIKGVANDPDAEEKHNLLKIIIVFVTLNINLHGSASSSEKETNSLQWFPSLASDNGIVYVTWADERNGNYTRIMNNQPHKSGDVYISKASFQNGWVFDKNIRINEIKGTTGHGSPSIAVDNNNLYVVWEDDRFGFEELYFSTAKKNNIKFKKDLPVVAEAGSQVLPSIAED